jgi:hypothetical protein
MGKQKLQDPICPLYTPGCAGQTPACDSGVPDVHMDSWMTAAMSYGDQNWGQPSEGHLPWVSMCLAMRRPLPAISLTPVPGGLQVFSSQAQEGLAEQVASLALPKTLTPNPPGPTLEASSSWRFTQVILVGKRGSCALPGVVALVSVMFDQCLARGDLKP